jgi:MtN3 and saliva related transmembrane protein
MTMTMITSPTLQESIGMIAGMLTTIAFLPQTIKIWRSKSAKDVSLAMFVCFCVGVVLWVIYGFMLGAFLVILTNVVTLCIAATIWYSRSDMANARSLFDTPAYCGNVVFSYSRRFSFRMETIRLILFLAG